MNKHYLLAFLLLGWLGARPARAQYLFQDGTGGLSPYAQNFDFLATASTFSSNRSVSKPEIYAESEFTGIPYYYAPPALSASDGSATAGKTTPDAGYYHFGYASGPNAGDRSFGGIASTAYTNGTGYVGIRFKNATSANGGVTIKNLEVQYAMEQWYNSGRQDAAQVDVSYLKGTTVTSLLQKTGTWLSISGLLVKAPSTATVIANRDGNSAANRRVVKATIPVNLAPGQEVMIRWAYALDNTTNGNGLSIDDVVVTPETNVFYSKATGDLNDLASWDQSPWTSTQTLAVAPPASFTADNQVFYVASPGVAATNINTDRIGVANAALGTTWTVSGLNSKIIVGSPTTPAALKVQYNKNISGVIDVSAGSYLYHQRVIAPSFTFGSLAPTSTVEYVSDGATHSVQANQYGNLTISGNNDARALNAKTLAGTTIVTGTLTFNGRNNLVLGNNDLTLLSSGSIVGSSATGYVVTNGRGRLRLQVPRGSGTAAGLAVLFPIGSTTLAYNPVTVQQTSATSDDVFEARVLDNIFPSYDASNSYATLGAALTAQAVAKTWLVSKEVPTNATSVTMSLQWNTGESLTSFTAAAAHVNHYTGGAWDAYQSELGQTGTGPYVATRSGITSFSPFGITSIVAPLPVELTSFDAQRTATGVQCKWATASEHNSQSFTVERSLDGQQFAALGRVAAAGSSVMPRSYAFLDAQPVAGIAYYRLRQTDNDGQATYSTVVAVAGAAPASYATAVPNPSAGTVAIAAASPITHLEVLTVLGTSVLAQQVAAPTQYIPLDLSSLPAGVYLVRLATAQGPQVVRVVKQ